MKAPKKLPTISRYLMKRPGFRLSLFIVVSAFVAAQLLVSSSARPYEKGLSYGSASGGATSLSSNSRSSNSGRAQVKFFDADPNRLLNASFRLSGLSFTSMQESGLETIATFQSDCTTAASSFTTGDTVCAHAGGTLVGQRRIYWVNPDSHVVQIDTVSSTSRDASRQVSQVGKWRVYLVDPSDGAARAVTAFSVSDPTRPTVDLTVAEGSGDGAFTSGGFARFTVEVSNNGPDPAATVQLRVTTPNNTTFSGVTQVSGPTFICTPGSPTICTIDSLAVGASATFTLVYLVDGSAAIGTAIVNTVDVTSATEEINPGDNTATIGGTVIGTSVSNPVPCSVGCPDDITTPANTTDQSNNPGAVVHFSPPSGNDECGAIVVSHCNDCFFPVGTTTVTATTSSGEGCSFTVTVTPSADRPSITCPPDKTANADSNCEATVTLETPTATGTNVTVIGTRSDGKPMYNCDCFPSSPNQLDDACNIFGACTRKSPDAPFSSGVITITWTAISHDTPGPYQTPADEEAHRTGSASCQQTVTVNDITPPIITPPPGQTASADATCQAAVPDFTTSTTVSDNCACSSSDQTENCVDRQQITVTQSPAPGTMVGLGPHTITLTANDGSSNNNGAGNTSTATTTFTVNDTTAPTITCPANITGGNDAGQCFATVSPGTATATDACDTDPTVAGTRSDALALNAPYPVGTTTITWTATDDAGNYSSCTQAVTVNDTQNPTITAPPNVTVYTGPGATSCSAVVSDTTLGTAVGNDNCPGVSVSRSPSGNTFPLGTTTVTWTATDAHGNSSAPATQTVTVIDNTPPVIVCPANISVELAANSTATSAVVNYTAPAGMDNCSATTTAQTAGLASGASFPVGTTTNTFRSTDAAGNYSECSFTVTVLYRFTGFFSPVSNPPTLNVVNGGQAIPVKFSLSGNKGLSIFADDSPYTVGINCDGTAPQADVTETVNAGNSSLSYSAGSDQYNYVWKTQNSWAGTCRQLIVKLNDGSVHTAIFRFK